MRGGAQRGVGLRIRLGHGEHARLPSDQRDAAQPRRFRRTVAGFGRHDKYYDGHHRLGVGRHDDRAVDARRQLGGAGDGARHPARGHAPNYFVGVRRRRSRPAKRLARDVAGGLRSDAQGGVLRHICADVLEIFRAVPVRAVLHVDGYSLTERTVFDGKQRIGRETAEI